MVTFLVLCPFSLIYACISLLIQYSTALKQRFGFCYRSPVPVVVVGNFTVGGTGKTPLVVYLYEQLQQQGFTPGIISRGYGRKSTGTLVVTGALSSQTAGDEALLMFQLTRGPVVVGHNKNKAIQSLLAAFPAVNVILSDDGLQNAGLQADIRVLVVDAERGLGNGWCVPAGPLRAPQRLGRFSQVDMVVLNETAISYQNASLAFGMPAIHSYPMRFEAMGFIKITPGIPYQTDAPVISVSDFIKDHRGKDIHAVAGIGNPARFFKSLKDMGLSITPHMYPDHHDFTAEDLTFKTLASIIMTEKDAVKCAPWLSDRDCWALKIRVTIEGPFSGRIGQLIQAVQPHSRSAYD